jgi:hypothetical protein
MGNRFTRACYVLTAGVAVSTALALSGAGAASASVTHAMVPDATPSCSWPCLNPYNAKWGSDEILKAVNSAAFSGNRLKLAIASNSSPGEDWVFYDVDTVTNLILNGLVSPQLEEYFGDDTGFELQFAPYGVMSGLCQGVSTPAYNGERVTLQTCGNQDGEVIGSTVWILGEDIAPPPYEGFLPIISGTTTNFSDPQVLAAKALNRLVTFRLQGFSDGQIYSNQLWWAFPGEVGPAL